MPHCALWTPSDWEFALDTLEIATRSHDNGGASWCTELRYREPVMGKPMTRGKGCGSATSNRKYRNRLGLIIRAIIEICREQTVIVDVREC